MLLFCFVPGYIAYNGLFVLIAIYTKLLTIENIFGKFGIYQIFSRM